MIEIIGGPDRDRTDDLFHAMEARSQLRHRPTPFYSEAECGLRQCLAGRQRGLREQCSGLWCLRLWSERALCRRRRSYQRSRGAPEMARICRL